MPAEPSGFAGPASAAFDIRTVALDVVLPLRHTVLRAGRPFESAISTQDSNPRAVHHAAFAGEMVIGVVSQYPEDTPMLPGVSSDRFRGMAVDPAWQGRGVGRSLMAAVAGAARARGAAGLWANGRDTALGFYTSIGFRIAGDGFLDEAMQLPHHVVVAAIADLRLVAR